MKVELASVPKNDITFKENAVDLTTGILVSFALEMPVIPLNHSPLQVWE
jgi:hypothetical protein